MTDPIQSILESVVRAIVDDPTKAEVGIFQGDQTTVYQVRVAKKDVGKIIGKQGSMAKALRQILLTLSVKHDRRCVMEILE